MSQKPRLCGGPFERVIETSYVEDHLNDSHRNHGYMEDHLNES